MVKTFTEAAPVFEIPENCSKVIYNLQNNIILVGDKVYDSEINKTGNVTAFNKNKNFPIKVSFDGIIRTYTIDGKLWKQGNVILTLPSKFNLYRIKTNLSKYLILVKNIETIFQYISENRISSIKLVQQNISYDTTHVVDVFNTYYVVQAINQEKVIEQWT